MQRIKRSAKKNTHGPSPRIHNKFTLFRGSHTHQLIEEVTMPTAKKPVKKATKPAAKKAVAKKPAAKAKKKAPAKKK